MVRTGFDVDPVEPQCDGCRAVDASEPNAVGRRVHVDHHDTVRDASYGHADNGVINWSVREQIDLDHDGHSLVHAGGADPVWSESHLFDHDLLRPEALIPATSLDRARRRPDNAPFR